MIRRSFRYRLYPTKEQAERLSQFIGATRFVYNLALEQRRIFGGRGRRINFATQCQEITQLRAAVAWINDCPITPLQQALRDLGQAFSNFFAKRSGFPSPRARGSNDAMRFMGRDIATAETGKRTSLIRIPKIGSVRYRDTRPMQGRCLNVTISRVAGQWFASFACEIEHDVAQSTLPAVGIDRGIANTVALSTGELLSTPDTAALERRKRKAQRILARRKRGSHRYRKQRLRVARIAAKIARVRTDWRHKTTTGIARRFGHVVLEDLQTRNMMASGPGKRGLNRSIAERGWRSFETVLSYKLEERGGSLEKINPAYTSQTCSSCGTVDKASRESQASFACRHCGFVAHADTNAAVNILRRSPAFAEGSGYAPVEARTSHALAA